MEKTDEVRKLIEASAWRVRLAEADADADECPHRQELERWIAADPRNAEAWKQVDGLWELIGEHATAPEVIAARREALTRANQVGRKRWSRSAPFGRHWVSAVAATLLLAVGFAFMNWQSTRFDVYSTGVSERHTITLEDGSTVALDAKSEVRVRYSAGARELQLVHGQAKFDVVSDVERPFYVVAGKRKIVAVGTSFNVDVLQSKLLVTLIDGRLVIVPQSAESERRRTTMRGDGRIELTSGKQLVIEEQAPPRIVDVDVDLATAWQTGTIIFDDETLAEAVARFNRYSDNMIIVKDLATRNLRISGVFRTSDLNGFVATVTSYLPVMAAVQSNGDVELIPRPK